MSNTFSESTQDSLDVIVDAARRNDADAWVSIVHLFTPLLRSITRQYRLCEADGHDVRQTVWLRLATHIGDLRDAKSLPGWISTVARRACLDMLRRHERTVPVDPNEMSAICTATIDDTDEPLLRRERQAEARAALSQLPQSQQRLMTLLMADPPLSYARISQVLGIPIGSIGPTRARCLRKLELAAGDRELAA